MCRCQFQSKSDETMNPSEHRSALGRSMFPLLSNLTESIRIEASNLASLVSQQGSTTTSHASVDFVRRLAESTSVASEQTIASEQSVELTAAAADAATTTNESTRVEFVVRCVHCYLRGVELVDGALVAAAQLTQSTKLTAKRIGYMALSLFLAPPRVHRDGTELLLVASLQRDLGARRPIEQCLALAALDSLHLDVNVAPALLPLIRELVLRSPNVAVRARATVSLARLMARGVDIGDSAAVASLLAHLLGDPSPSVLGAALVWLLDLLDADAPCPIRSSSLCEALVGILRQCIDFCLPADLNAGAVGAPFVQIKLLRCIAALGRRAAMGEDVGGVARVNPAPVLSALLGSLQSLSSPTAAAVLIEVAKTVAALPNNAELRRAVAETATPLLAAHSSAVVAAEHQRMSAAYVGARRMPASTARAAALAILRHVGADAFDQRLRQLVVECLDTDDDTLQRLTLDLLSSVTNANNVGHIVHRMSICARDATTLSARLGLLRQAVRLIDHAPTQEWHATTLLSMMLAHCSAEVGGSHTHGGWLRASPRVRTDVVPRSACEYLAQQLTAYVFMCDDATVWAAVAAKLLSHDGALCMRALELAALTAAHVEQDHAIVTLVFDQVARRHTLTSGVTDAVFALAALRRPSAAPLGRLSRVLQQSNWTFVASHPRTADPRATEWIVACGGDAATTPPPSDGAQLRWRKRHEEQAAPQTRHLDHTVSTPSLSPRTPMTASRLKFAEPSPAMAASTSSSGPRSPTVAVAASTTTTKKPWTMSGWSPRESETTAKASASTSQVQSESGSGRENLVRELFGNE